MNHRRPGMMSRMARLAMSQVRHALINDPTRTPLRPLLHGPPWHGRTQPPAAGLYGARRTRPHRGLQPTTPTPSQTESVWGRWCRTGGPRGGFLHAVARRRQWPPSSVNVVHVVDPHGRCTERGVTFPSLGFRSREPLLCGSVSAPHTPIARPPRTCALRWPTAI